MDYDNLVASFSRTKQYEAAGTVWMLDPICSDIDDVSVSQLEGAMGMWSEATYRLSSSHAPSRRLSFDVLLPVSVVDEKVAQRVEPGKPGVCVTEALTMLAGRAVVITWYSAMSEALQQSNDDRVWYLCGVEMRCGDENIHRLPIHHPTDNCILTSKPITHLHIHRLSYHPKNTHHNPPPT